MITKEDKALNTHYNKTIDRIANGEILTNVKAGYRVGRTSSGQFIFSPAGKENFCPVVMTRKRLKKEMMLLDEKE